MARRQVTRTGKNTDGDITALCNPSEVWQRRSKQEAINDIDHGLHIYYVDVRGVGPVNVVVMNDSGRNKYLRTDPDRTSRNNLDELPNC